jgi:hypothetical protein
MWNLDGAWNGAGVLPVPIVTIPNFDEVNAGVKVVIGIIIDNATEAGELTYEWEQLAGDAVAFEGGDTNQITFTAPAGELSQYIVFDVHLTNGSGKTVSHEVTVPVLSVVAGVTVIRPEIVIDAGFMNNDAAPLATMYQHSDNFIYCTIKSDLRQLINPANFPVAEYVIADFDGSPLVKLSVGQGITQWEDGFLIHVDDKQLDSEILGKYRHQFVVHNIAGDKLPPVFAGTVKVKSVIQ